MASEVRSFTVTVPAGTTAAAPFTLDCSFPPRQVDGIEIIVPPGPNGVLGFNIANSDVTVIPYDSDGWIIASDEKIAWQLDGYINSGSWQINAYNTGTLPHTFYVRFLLSTVGQSASAGVTAPLDAIALSNPGPPSSGDFTLSALQPATSLSG